MSSVPHDLVAVVLAAGQGSRMRPLTDRVPKPLLTVGNIALLDLALRRAAALLVELGIDPSSSLAVNAHHLADQITAAVTSRWPGIRISQEHDELLGTAGALGRLRPWIAGRPVLVLNSDVYLASPLTGFLDGWDGRRPRLLVTDVGRPSDFGTKRFVGVSTVPAAAAADFPDRPAGLYGLLWKKAWEQGDLELIDYAGHAFDCGTPAEFITANLAAAGARTVIAADAAVTGAVDLSVVLAGATVGADERLVGAIRDRFGQTLLADRAAIMVPDGI